MRIIIQNKALYVYIYTNPGHEQDNLNGQNVSDETMKRTKTDRTAYKRIKKEDVSSRHILS